MATHPLRAEFDLDPELIYLNSGTHSLCPRRVIDAVVRELRQYELNPTAQLIETYPRMWEIQKDVAAFLKARPEDLYLRPNVTASLNVFLMGIELENAAGGEILVSDSEYGATVNICRLRAERDGMKLRSFHLPGKSEEIEGLTPERLADTVIRELRPETRILLLSHVATGNGMRLPLEPIARETRKRGIVLAVDAAHATAALELDFARLSDVDFYGGNLHKWVMGPKGTAYGWVHPRMQPRLKPITAGWMTFEVNPAHGKFAPGHPFAQKFYDSACIDFSPYLALHETFAFWREWGARPIRARLQELRDCVETEMKAHTGWKCLTPTHPELRGPLLSYELPERLLAEGYALMQRVLREHRVQIASTYFQGGWVLRISPHVHNSEDEIRRAAEAFAKL
jgi:isopenicillin-N epimerase